MDQPLNKRSDPFPDLGVRELARKAGISPTTATRLKRGEEPSASVAGKVAHLSAFCLCCGAPRGCDPELIAAYEDKIRELLDERNSMARTIYRLVVAEDARLSEPEAKDNG